MVEDIAGTVLFFAAAWCHLPEIVFGENDGPRLEELGEALSKTVEP